MKGYSMEQTIPMKDVYLYHRNRYVLCFKQINHKYRETCAQNILYEPGETGPSPDQDQ